MKKLTLIFAALFCIVLSNASGRSKLKFACDVDFEMNFDNREFYKSNFSSSMTIFGARLTPSVGVELSQPDNGMSHRRTSAHLLSQKGLQAPAPRRHCPGSRILTFCVKS